MSSYELEARTEGRLGRRPSHRRLIQLTKDDDYDVLEPDADEFMLRMLARDPEPTFRPDKPHRRYVAPDHLYRNSQIEYVKKSMTWEQLAEDWWLQKGDGYGRPK